jgi:hypothetical protein
LDLAIEAGVKRLMLFHHDPEHSDTFLDAIGALVQHQVVASHSGISCELAREGSTVQIEIDP